LKYGDGGEAKGRGNFGDGGAILNYKNCASVPEITPPLLRPHISLLFYGYELVPIHPCQFFHIPIGPSNPDAVHTRGVAEAEMEPHVIMGKIAPTAPNFLDLGFPSRLNFHAGADCIAIGAPAFES